MTTTEQVPSRPAGGRSGGEIIRTSKLTKVYAGSDFAAVDQLDLTVHPGEIFGLLGPNGAGKTTTAGMLTTRVIPTSGEAHVGGIDVIAHPALAKQLIGVVSQQNTLDRALTVWENLYFHGLLFGVTAKESRRVTDELLEQFVLSKWGKASVYALSGGMAQRLMVARAIFHRPAVLFMDEPTAGLDPQSRLALWEILGTLNDQGQTILLTTHYMEEADQLCDRVAIMDHGKILALDTPGALKASVGIDTIVTVRAAGEPQVLADLLEARVDDVQRVRLVETGVELYVKSAAGRPAAAGGQRRRGRRHHRDRPVGLRGHARDRLHHPHRQGPARLMAIDVEPGGAAEAGGGPPPSDADIAAADAATTAGLVEYRRQIGLGEIRPTFAASRLALAALIRRDLVVLRKDLVVFCLRTVIQPFLLVFVFLYVFPTIGQGIGSSGTGPAAAARESAFATVLVPGVVAISIMFQGIQAVALQMSQEFGFTREIEDRVQAPCPIWLVAMAKILSAAAQGLLSAILVFPIAAVVHAPGVEAHLTFHWWILVTLIPLACLAMSSLGLLLGTSFEPRNIGLMFGFIVLPLTFLGGTYYQWTKLSPVHVAGFHWLQILVLVNPLIYVTEGMRAALTNTSHMHLYVIYPMLSLFLVVFLALGLRNFKRRVLS